MGDVRDIVRSVWGRCEALEDEAADKLAQPEKLTLHEQGFWRGQKMAAKSIRRSTEMPTPEALAASPEVQKLVADAVAAERERCGLAVANVEIGFHDGISGDWHPMSGPSIISAACAAIRRAEGEPT